MLQLPVAIAELASPVLLPELGPGSPNQAFRAKLASLTPESMGPVRDHTAAMACISGLWLLHDFLDESHTISQEINEWYGSHWHAIMHRREPDAWNSKYWWQRVGRSPIFPDLIEQSAAIGYRFTSPQDFVDFAERHRGSGTEQELLARRVQRLEWELLFGWCFAKAIAQ